MTRVVIRFKDGEHLNVPADCIDFRDGWIIAWKGDYIVVIAKADEVSFVGNKESATEAKSEATAQPYMPSTYTSNSQNFEAIPANAGEDGLPF